MIIIHEGVPGSGKSYDAMRKIVDALKAGRTVYTNIDGAEKEECREAIAALVGTTRDDLAGRYVHLQRGQVIGFWDFAPPGSFVVIDEAQLYFNSRDFNKADNRAFADWASEHRHQGYDLLLITQRQERIDTAVRSLAEFRYRYRKLNIFGNMVKKGYLIYTYCGDDSKPLGSPRRATYQGHVFPTYKSYVGDATEKNVNKNPNLFRHPIFIFAGFLLIASIWSFSKSSFASGDPLGYKAVTARAEKARKDLQTMPPAIAGAKAASPPSSSGGAAFPSAGPAAELVQDENRLVGLPVSALIKKGGKAWVMVGNYRLTRWARIDEVNLVVWARFGDVPVRARSLII